ncbi:MAG: hypothetical protein J6F30_12860 [Cellulosilyticum sp.]|nr:hypothetical protein [Cellulosilyticum sp.]
MGREFYQEGWGRNQSGNDFVASYNTSCTQNMMQDFGTTMPCNNCPNAEKCDCDMMAQMKQPKNLFGYDQACTMQMQSGGQSNCCPFDAYGLNTYNRSYTPINVVKDCIEDLCIPLTISVKIPVGFIVPKGRHFGTYLAIDKSALSTNTITQHYVYTNKCGCTSPEVVKMQVSILNGPLYYNLTLDNIVPAQGIQSMTQSETYVNKHGALSVDKVLGYAPFGYATQDYYAIEVIPQRETITLPDGKCVCKNAAQEEYKCLLANPDIERVLTFSYIVVIKSVNMA